MTSAEGHFVFHSVGKHFSGWRTFFQPSEIFRTEDTAEIPSLLEDVARHTRKGAWAAGFIAYEGSPAFDSAFQVRSPRAGFPLAWFGIYPEAHVHRGILPPHSGTLPRLTSSVWQADLTQDSFRKRILHIREEIAAGNTYQANFTHRHHTSAPSDAWSYFVERLLIQPVPYAAFLDIDSHAICSWSPELFFHQEGSHITCRPMKGTAPASDRSIHLVESVKNRAENIMIVDMIRNDLGKIALPGTVAATRVFEAESYSTLHQMTSTVEAETRNNWVGVLHALFPCASITGAPKIQTMRILCATEDSPRGLYTGALGFVRGSEEACFNVPIRTAVIDRRQSRMEYGVGSGIVWDSTADGEWEECRQKMETLSRTPPVFDLLETMRWTPDEGFQHLSLHLNRLLKSAGFFGYPISRYKVIQALEAASHSWDHDTQRVRLLGSSSGLLRVEASPIPIQTSAVSATMDDRPVDTANLFHYHKTTERKVYEDARMRHPDFDDVLLWNKLGMACEFTIGNLVLRLHGRYVTPPIEHGLLPGVQRAFDLARGRIEEAPISLADLEKAEAVYRINSLRGWIPVTLSY